MLKFNTPAWQTLRTGIVRKGHGWVEAVFMFGGLVNHTIAVELRGPRGQDLGLVVPVEAPGPTVGVVTNDGRKFLYDALCCTTTHIRYREYVEYS